MPESDLPLNDPEGKRVGTVTEWEFDPERQVLTFSATVAAEHLGRYGMSSFSASMPVREVPDSAQIGAPFRLEEHLPVDDS